MSHEHLDTDAHDSDSLLDGGDNRTSAENAAASIEEPLVACDEAPPSPDLPATDAVAQSSNAQSVPTPQSQAIADFDQAALLSTLRFWTDVNEVAAYDAEAPLRLLAGAAHLRLSQTPPARACGEALERGRVCAQRETERVLGIVKETREQAATVLERALDGSLSSESEHLSVSQDRHGNTRILSSSYDGGETSFAVLTTQSLSVLAGIFAPAVIENKVAACMKAVQPMAWEALLTGVEDRYRSASIAEQVVVPVFTTNVRGETVLGLRNISGMDLRKVLVYCDLYHFKTFPFSESAQLIAREVWPRDETIYVARTRIQNRFLTQQQIQEIARPSNAEPRNSDLYEFRRLEELDGIVAIDISAWSEQAASKTSRLWFHDRAIQAARFDLAWMYALARSHHWSTRSINRLLGFLPEDSTERQLAANLRDNEKTAIQEWRTAKASELMSRLKSGTAFRGTTRYSVRVWDRPENEGHPRTIPRGMTPARTTRMYERHGHTLEWTLTVVSQDPQSNQITVVASLANQPSIKQRFIGELRPLAAPHAAIIFKPLPQRNRYLSELEEIGSDMLSGRFNLVVWLNEDGSLSGHSATYDASSDEFGFVFELQSAKN